MLATVGAILVCSAIRFAANVGATTRTGISDYIT